MPIMQAPPGTIAAQTIKLLSGTTYTVDSSLFIGNVTSQADVIALGNMGFLQVPGRMNFTATVDPVVGNDNTQDYNTGSEWLNTSQNRLWFCVSAATGNAVWIQISIGALIATANSATFANQTLTGILTRSSAAAVTAFNGGGQSSATLITTDFANITTAASSSSPYDSVKFSALLSAGQRRLVANNATNPVQLFGFNTDAINGFASGTGVTLPVGFIGTVECVASGVLQIKNLPSFTTNNKYNTNASTSGTTLAGNDISGGVNFTTLAMTGTLGAGANAQLPTVANLVAASNFLNAVAGVTWRLRILNLSSGAFAWTVTTNTGWTLNGTSFAIAQSTWRDFDVTLTSTAAAVLQSVGTGTYT